MDPITTGALISGGLNLLAAERANRQTVDLSNTAYQRAMADMRKAGLNPILAGKLGGASTPVMQNVAQAATQGYTSTMQAHSAKNLQSEQASVAKADAESKELANKITKLQALPKAQAQGFAMRLAADVVDHVETLYRMAKGPNIYVLDGETERNLKNAINAIKYNSTQGFNTIMNGINSLFGGQSGQRNMEADKTNGFAQQIYDMFEGE